MSQMTENEVIDRIEQNKDTQDVLRFLIKDHAFDEDFLITAIEWYLAKNRKSIGKRG